MIKDNKSNTSADAALESFVVFNPYVFRKTGIVQSSTYIRIDNYFLICMPWKISSREIFLIASLNAKERELFQKYHNSHCSVFISCLDGKTRGEFKILVQTTIRQIGPIANRDSMCFLRLAVRNCPETLQKILQDYLKHTEELKTSYERNVGRKVSLDSKEVSRLLGFNDYAEIHLPKREIPVRILCFGVDELEFVVSSVHSDFSDARELNLKLYFLQNRFFVRGRIIGKEPFGNIYSKYSLMVEFSPDLIDILDLYFAVDGKTLRKTGSGNSANPEPYEELETI